MRLTEAEWNAVQRTVQADGHKNATNLFRVWLAPILAQAIATNG